MLFVLKSQQNKSPHRILVDSSSGAKAVPRDFLAARGFQIDETFAYDLSEEDLAEFKPDVIAMEIWGNDSDELERCRRFGESFAIPVIVFSLGSNEALRLCAYESGAVDYINFATPNEEIARRFAAVAARLTNSNTQSFPALA